MKQLDTTVAIDHLRGHPGATGLIEEILDGDAPLGASELVRYELIGGVRRGEAEALERFFDGLFWLPVTEDVARMAGDLARRYRPAHAGIDDAHYLIAATALAADADLLTTNVRHFPMFAGLEPPY